MTLAELQDLERRVGDPHLRSQPGRVRARPGRQPVGRRWQRVPRLPRGDLRAERRALPSARGRSDPGSRPTKLTHVSNLYYTEPAMRLSSRCWHRARLGGKVFLCNSGAEANEAAIKLARRHRAGGEIVVLRDAFHGRTYGALSATPQEAKQAPFAPLVPGFVVCDKDRCCDRRGGRSRRQRPCCWSRSRVRAGCLPLSEELLRGRPCGLRSRGRGADLRRGSDRDGADRNAVGLRADRCRAGCADDRQGAGRRSADRRAGDRPAPGGHASARRSCLDLRRRACRLCRRVGRARDLLRRRRCWSMWSPSASDSAAALAELPFVTSVRGRGLLLGAELVPGVSAVELARRALLEQRLVINATGPSSLRMEPPLIVTEPQIDEAVARLGAASVSARGELLSPSEPLESVRFALGPAFRVVSEPTDASVAWSCATSSTRSSAGSRPRSRRAAAGGCRLQPLRGYDDDCARVRWLLEQHGFVRAEPLVERRCRDASPGARGRRRGPRAAAAP